MGDLITTCVSSLSRNYRLGKSIASGKTVEESLVDLQGTAEGIETLLLVKKKIDFLNIDLPIVNSVYDIVYRNSPPSDFVSKWINK
jgi:glycerol-3-phosphate dehydrogenase (NAD(P)+)